MTMDSSKSRMLLAVGVFAASALVLSGCSASGGTADTAETVTLNIATVDNSQMKDMESLKGVFEEANPDIKVNFTVMQENDLRDAVTKDVATGAGQYDIVTVGAYEVPIWGGNDWLTDLTTYANDDAAFDVEDILPSVRNGLTSDGKLYGVPFYGESSFLMYNKDIFAAAGVSLSDNPTWAEVATVAQTIKDGGFADAGICLRGLPGWGELFAPLTTVVQTFGGSWFDESWNQGVDSPEFIEAVTFYTDLVKSAGQPDPASAGFTECLNYVKSGKAAMWYDATSAAGILEASDSPVAGKMGYVQAPVKETAQSGWLWSWNLAMPKTTTHSDAAWKFMSWATSKEYINLVGNEIGWANVPPGSRTSTYAIPEYAAAASAFGPITLKIMDSVNPEQPGVNPQPWVGVQFVSIPEFQDLANTISQDLAAVFAGTATASDVLKASAALAQTAGDAQK
jgi:sorbitol/mannitol transport system substrate-binding protein